MSIFSLIAVIVFFQACPAFSAGAPRYRLEKSAVARLNQDRDLVDHTRKMLEQLIILRLDSTDKNELDKINNKIREIENNSQICPICLDELRFQKYIISSSCGHLYCSDCFESRELAEVEVCPMCRSEDWRMDTAEVTYPGIQENFQ
jgi:hypothetical protein